MDWTDALRQELESWAGTPYVSGQGLRGVAADCVGFGAGVYDALHGYDPDRAADVPRHSPDVAFNNPALAARISAQIKSRWPDVSTVFAPRHDRGISIFSVVQPGDALIVAVGRNAPGHLMIVGTRPCEVWHCIEEAGVVRSGLGQWAARVKRVWRSGVRERWAESWRH